MTPKQFVVGSDSFGLTARSSARVRIIVVSAGLAVAAIVVWQWAVRGSSSSQRALEITVLGVRDVPAPATAAPIAPALPAAATVERTPPPAVDAAPAAAVAPPPPPARPSAPSRPAVRTPPSRSAASRAAPAKPVAAEEPRAEAAPAKPHPEAVAPTKPAPAKPDSPPLETNPYVYK